MPIPFPIIRGSLLPFLQWEENSFDPQRGFIYRAEYRGLSQALCLQLQNNYISLGIASKVRTQFDVTTIEAEDATQQFTLDVWQVIGNEERYDNFSHPTVLSLITPAGIAVMREDLDNNVSSDQMQQDVIAGGITSANAAILARFYGLKQRGSTDYRKSQYVLRHTTNVSNVWQQNISDVGIDLIYSTAKLITECTNGINGFNWINPLPGRLQFKIQAIPIPAMISNYMFGWLKSSSTETTSANNRVDIVTEYTLENWSTDEYSIF